MSGLDSYAQPGQEHPSAPLPNRPMRPIKLIPLLTLFAASLPAQWQLMTTPVKPSSRRAGAMAFHEATNRIVLYGGLSATPSQVLSDTWTYNGTWTLSPATAPARWGHRIVSNTTSNRLITFGGRSPTINSLSNETMQWSGSSWTAMPTTGAPSARFLYGMCYDSQRDVVVLFGGRNLTGPNNETWELSGSTWTQVATVNSPLPREEMGMVYDASLGRTILFGGCDESIGAIYGDTWQYDGTNWIQAAPAVSPTPRFRGMMEYDSKRSRSIYYGGFDGLLSQTETYEYSGGNWVLSSQITVPTPTTEALSGYDSLRKRFVIFGGFGGSFLDETWELTGDTGGTFNLYGSGCDTANGTPGLTGTTPNIGSTLNLGFSNLGSAQTVVVVLGLSDTLWNGLPLPLDLGGVGLPGCGLLASADALDLALASNGLALYGFPIPNQINLVNLPLYCQGVVTDFVPTLTFLGATRGGRAVIGQ